jgi:2-oxoglutarate dehydrogenase E1 component
MKRFCWDELEKSYAKSKTLDYKAEDWMTEDWEAIKIIDNYDDQKESGITRERLVDVGDKITALPEDAKFHRLVKKIFDARSDSIKNGVGIDWGTAEALAFSTLIQDGYHVRISGQDVERGTFSHRHAHVFYQD